MVNYSWDQAMYPSSHHNTDFPKTFFITQWKTFQFLLNLSVRNTFDLERYISLNNFSMSYIQSTYGGPCTASIYHRVFIRPLHKVHTINLVYANTWDKAGRTWLMFQRLMPTFGVFSIRHLPSEQGSRRSPAPRLYWTQVQYRPITHTNTKTGTSQITLLVSLAEYKKNVYYYTFMKSDVFSF